MFLSSDGYMGPLDLQAIALIVLASSFVLGIVTVRFLALLVPEPWRP